VLFSRREIGENIPKRVGDQDKTQFKDKFTAAPIFAGTESTN